jgi:hypothetical protein
MVNWVFNRFGAGAFPRLFFAINILLNSLKCKYNDLLNGIFVIIIIPKMYFPMNTPLNLRRQEGEATESVTPLNELPP